MEKLHIEKNTVQETLVIPLYGRKLCSERFPQLFQDPEAARLCDMLDYNFEENGKKMESVAGLFGALEVAQRQYDLAFEVKEYLKSHPRAAVVNLGCGLDDTFRRVQRGSCLGYNIDLPDVIELRNRLLGEGERERNLAFDLTDDRWMQEIDASDGAVFIAAGVFYYLRTGALKTLMGKMAKRFPGGVLAFDTCNRRGATMMRKTWLRGAGIQDVDAFFSLEDPMELEAWSPDFASVTSKSYMRGYRDILPDVRPLYRLMIRFCDGFVRMRIVRIAFRG